MTRPAIPQTCRGARAARCLLFAVVVATSASEGAVPAQERLPAHAQPPSGVSPGDLLRLRPAVLPDLKKAIAITLNQSTVSANQANREFRHCKFSAIQLGTLGAAVVVEWNPMNAPNASMINIYAVEHGAYRRIAEGAGFGPDVLAGSHPIPDLVFGGAGGVCHSSYSRYRFQNGAYAVDACDQETEGKDGECAMVACENKLPTFPHATPE